MTTVLVITTALLGGVHVVAHAVVAPAAGVHGDDARNAFVIRAGTSQPGSSDSGTCSGCATVIAVPVCVDGIQFTSPQPGSGCLALDGRCHDNQRFVRQWTSSPTGWLQGEATCADLSAAPTVAQIGTAVRDSVVRRVPAATITTQPSAGALVRVPLLLHSRQPQGDLQWQDTVAGVPVTTRVSAAWEWRFGDGARLATAQAGSTWPDTSVSHTYTDPGRYRVSVTTEWTGSYVIAGLGPLSIDGSVTQNADVSVRIRTAGAVLEPVLR